MIRVGVLGDGAAADSLQDLENLIRLAEDHKVSLTESIDADFRLTAGIIRKALSRLGTLQKARSAAF